MPLCTVAIPVYNRLQFIDRALASARAQEVAELEILVIDNCSTDGTWEFLQSQSSAGLRLLRNPGNIGLFGNLNRCLVEARGKYIRVLCSDDRLLPGCLAHEIDILEQHPPAVLVSAQGQQVTEDGRPLRCFANLLEPGIYHGEYLIPASLWLLSLYGSPFNFPSGVLLRRDAVRQVGGFDPELFHLGDLEFYLRLAEVGPVAITDHIGCEVSVHPQQESNRLLDDGRFTEEWLIVARRWAALLEQASLWNDVVNQTAASSLAIAVRQLRRGKLGAAARYFGIARRQALSTFGLARSSFRYYLGNACLRLGRLRLPRHLRRGLARTESL